MNGGQFTLEARRRAGLSQRQVADRSGLSQPEIARIESGIVSPSLTRIFQLVRACGFDLSIRLVLLDEDAFTLAEQNLDRTPDQRLETLAAGLAMLETGRRSREGVDA